MTGPGRPAPSTPPPDADDPRARTIGVALIAVALVIGVVLLAKGFSQEDGLVATDVADTDETTGTTSATGGGIEETTTTTASVARPPAEVPVLVANGTGTSGVAATNASKLEAAGYTEVETTNASTTARSNVYYVAGSEADAKAVATTLSLEQATVVAMPSPPPVELGGATVLVVIGTDRT